jgi:hypothetical protein
MSEKSILDHPGSFEIGDAIEFWETSFLVIISETSFLVIVGKILDPVIDVFYMLL